MSRFSEKRLAEDLAKVVSSRLPNRRRNDLAIFGMSVGIGVFGNFYFGKVEVGIAYLSLSLFSLGDWIATLGPLQKLRGLWRFAFDTIFCIAVMALPAHWLFDQYRMQHAALTDGSLVAQDTFADVKEGTYVVEISGQKFVPDQTNHHPFEILSDKMNIDIHNGQLELSIVVRDRQGNLIAEVRKNKWHVYPTAADKNYSQDALEVLDGRGHVGLQVQLLTNGIRFGGEFYNEQSGPVYMGTPLSESNKAVAPWFQYRSIDHWGERTEFGERMLAPH